MVADSLITARVSAETKERFAVFARYQGLSESALLKRLLEAALLTAVAVKPQVIEPVKPVPVGGKISVRLRTDDLLLLRERATARALPTGTYVSYLIRAHLRSVTPLPTGELAALKRTLAEVGAIGRNLNQIAHAVNQGERPTGPSRADAQALMRALYGLRDHIKAVITANLTSWEVGYEKANH
jgi:predicted DNA binding CopG/RHH family protein